MNRYERVHASVDLDAIVDNIKAIKNNLSPKTNIMAVIKTDGYGHGAVPVARKLEPLPYITGFAVATAEEAFSLRRNGIKKKILLLGAIFEYQFEELILLDITLPIYSRDTARKLSETAAALHRDAVLHLKLDTAMSRLGIPADNDGVLLAEEIGGMKNIRLEGVFTHFSRSDETDKSVAMRQLSDFNAFVGKCMERGISFKYRHMSNSAAAIDISAANFDFVRAGISIYGLYPSDQVNREKVRLKPAMQLKSCVCYLKEIKAGTCVGYGGTYKADKDTMVATIPVGYGDGYPRLLSNRGYVLIKGRRANIIGRICMDQFMVDVTGINGIELMDEAVLIGESCGKSISVEELSLLCGRFNYEFVCDLGKRIPRVYLENGNVTMTRDCFSE